MVIGKYKYSVDSKNRICIPHKFRTSLGDKCVFSKDLTYKCLNLYSMEQWEKYCEKIEQLPSVGMEDVRFFIYSNSNEVDIDNQGRIVLQQQLCEEVGLLNEKEVVVVGIFTHMQIWSAAEWEIFNKELNSPEKRDAVKNELRRIGF